MKKIILITGATSGIGVACAHIFAKNQYDIILTGRRENRLNEIKEKLEEEFQIECLTLSFDVRDNTQVEKAFDSIPKEWRNIDVLVNNAGLAVGLNPIQEGVLDDWERMIDTNVKGLLYVTRKTLPWLIERRNGHVINIASIAGKEVYPMGNVYCATKHAVDALSRAIRMDTVQQGIKVTNVAPGAVETEFSIVRFKGDESRADNVYKGYEPLSGEDVANVVYYIATLPKHVCINDIVITPTAQASASLFHKEL